LNDRSRVLEDLQEQALLAAIQQGADAKKVKIVDLQIIPYHYVPNQMARVIVMAAGEQGQ